MNGSKMGVLFLTRARPRPIPRQPIPRVGATLCGTFDENAAAENATFRVVADHQGGRNQGGIGPDRPHLSISKWAAMKTKRIALRAILVAAFAIQPTVPTIAQTYPSRPITIIVAFAAGGGGDAIARAIAEHLGPLLGQTFIIENVAGANGAIGVGRVARATGGGYTLLVGDDSPAINATLYDQLTKFVL
jgi:hypothetical protein